jgi:hypothetical protein
MIGAQYPNRCVGRPGRWPTSRKQVPQQRSGASGPRFWNAGLGRPALRRGWFGHRWARLKWRPSANPLHHDLSRSNGLNGQGEHLSKTKTTGQAAAAQGQGNFGTGVAALPKVSVRFLITHRGNWIYSLASMRRPCRDCKGRVFMRKMRVKVSNWLRLMLTSCWKTNQRTPSVQGGQVSEPV